MDEGSTITLIDAGLAKTLDLKGPSDPLKLSCIGELNTSDPFSQRVDFGISAPDSSVIYKISKARSIENLCLFRQSIQKDEVKNYPHLCHLPVEYYINAKPSILIGQDHWDLISATQVRYTTRNDPIASLTQLGWVIHGRIQNTQLEQIRKHAFLTNERAKSDHDSLTDIELNTLVKYNFTLDSMGIVNSARKNKLEERAERILARTAKPVGDHWQVGLLWKSDDVKMPNNRNYALNRLMSLERKMDKNHEYGQRYCSEVVHLIESNYAKKISKMVDSNPRTWYLPHFGVVNLNKPEKLRLVFDAAAKTEGVCLNDNLLTGPDLINSLLGVLIRFREGKIAIKGDIREMFLQVKMQEEDQQAQRFLWRGMDRDREPDTYVMTSMIFGSASSPYTAQYVMRRNALKFETSHPLATNAILRKYYVDDYLESVNTIAEGIERIKDVSFIQRHAGFEIRGWTSNNKHLLGTVPAEARTNGTVDLSKDQIPVERTLGLKWDPSVDKFSFDLSIKKVPKEIVNGRQKPTKREMLRIIMSIFDPLGILLPFTIRSKILLHDVWRSGIGWDEFLKTEEFTRWREWAVTLDQIANLRIPRPYCPIKIVPDNAELHVFSDASEKAYAAVAYLRTIFDDQTIYVSFIAGKARVAPLKPVSIPRMELQGALLASRLGHTIVKELEIKIVKRTFWTDSRTVLGWIRADPKKYQSFVAHRLGEIDELTNAEEWRWVPTKQNPGDYATKETGSVDSLMSQWISGPKFLWLKDVKWHEQPGMKTIIHPRTEMRREFLAVITEGVEYETPKIKNFSKWLCLLRSTALVLSKPKIWRDKLKLEITADLLEDAKKYLIRKVQQECFHKEIVALKSGQPLPKDSRLKNLTPTIATTDEILKIDGRINAVQDVSESVKFPIILDGKHYFTRLLIQYYHERFHHGSTETVVNELKQEYWIIKIRPSVRSVSSQCRLCRLRRAKAQQPRMGDMPEARLKHHWRPFTHCGLDYFGPMHITVGRRNEKRWGALFTCLTSRAIHLELVSSLSTDSAIMALQRMSNRRGTPTKIFSDNGTNFTGMNTELKNAIKEMDQKRLHDEMANRCIKWQFIPPASPHMGGSWERLVRSVKTSLAVILKERAPKEEVLRILLTEVEHVVNSRPLTSVSVDYRDKEALTPNHWLIGSSSGSVVRGEFTDDDLCRRKQWRISQRLADMFWARWMKEYLPNLVIRKTWTQEVRNLSKGDVVLIADSTMPRNTWPKGIITAVYPGKDGRVRVIDVRSRGRILKRAANKIIVLVPATCGTEMQHSRTGVENVNDGGNV